MQLQPAASLQTIRSAPTRLTHQRLRSPTRLPTVESRNLVARYLERLSWLFGGA